MPSKTIWFSFYIEVGRQFSCKFRPFMRSSSGRAPTKNADNSHLHVHVRIKILVSILTWT